MTASPASAPARPAANDAELLQRLRGGDERAFLELVSRHQGAFRRIALGFAPSVAVAEEIVQETWGAVLEALPSFEGRSSVKTWLFRILINRARTRAEREGRSVPFSALEPEPGGEAAAGVESFQPDGHWASPVRSWHEDTPEALILRREVRRVIDRAMDGLPPQQRTVLTLRDVEGLESNEVCNIVGISESNQRVLLHRARVRVRAAVAKYLDAEET
jgi:RNA polymerase sigma-70 factor (ECF subfamily)